MSRLTTLEWPEAALGCPLRAAYRGSIDQQWMRTEVEDGPARYRRVRNAERRVYQLEFIWTADQMAKWETFHANTLEAGMRWFMMPQLASGTMRPMFCHMLGGWEVVANRDRLDLFEITFEVEAFHSAASEPAPGLTGGPIDGGMAAAPSPDVIDAAAVTAARPADVVNSLTPGALT